MRGVVMYAPGDVRVEDREGPKLVETTDAIVRVTASCLCGSDLWPYRGAEPVERTPMGHEYVGIVQGIGSDVRSIRAGDFVVGSFFASDNTCEICRSGYQTHCVHRQPGAPTGAQSEYARVPMADGTLVATAAEPAPELIPSLLAASDVLGTGWFAAIAAKAGPGKTVAVVGDGAVGLLGILAAKELVDVAVGVAGAKFTSITTPITTCGDAASSRRSIGSGSSSGNRRGNSRRSESQHEHHKLNPDPRGCHRCRAFGADLYRHPIHPSER